MLIEFSVTNFRSIKQTQTLKLTASPASELKDSNCFMTNDNTVPPLLRSAVLYGPNASGKSNLLSAVAFMERFVMNSSKESQEGESIKVKPFLFDNINHAKPSEFEVLFIQDEVRYQYGFSVNRTRVVHEWLLAYPEGRAQRWFERKYDTDAQKDVWYFGNKFKGNKIILQESTRSNALFLSTAVQLNNEQLKPVYNWFYYRLRPMGGDWIQPSFTIDMCKDKDKKDKILNFLNAADLSIADIQVEMKKFDSKKIHPLIADIFKEVTRDDLEGKEFPIVSLLHNIEGSNELGKINLEDESDGTQRLFNLAGPWLDVLENGYILLIDELDKSLHPLMVRFLIGLIQNKKINRSNAQLIFSTHDTSVLDNKIFRRDQIWFIEKDLNNSSILYPLSDFTPRKGEALEKNYLQGRYGALPYIGDICF